LQQVLLNLLLNARDAIPDTGTIRVDARRAGARLVLEVADDGEGIAEEDIAKVFDPFFTTKPRGRGTGLGLSLSYTIVREHRGERRGGVRPPPGPPVRRHPARPDAARPWRHGSPRADPRAEPGPDRRDDDRLRLRRVGRRGHEDRRLPLPHQAFQERRGPAP